MWGPVASELDRTGYETAVLDLTGIIEAGSPSADALTQAIARSASGRSAILIGHSRAGPLLAAAKVMAWPQWWDEDELARLIPRLAVRQRFVTELHDLTSQLSVARLADLAVALCSGARLVEAGTRYA